MLEDLYAKVKVISSQLAACNHYIVGKEENADEQKRAQTEPRVAEAEQKADEKDWKAMQKLPTAGDSLNMDDMNLSPWQTQ
jgi:hypothetical protein